MFIIDLIFSYFGYCKKPPVEIVQLSTKIEADIKIVCVGLSQGKNKEYFRKILDGQSAITKYLRSMRS